MIDSLSALDKAKILYNHIWFGSLRNEYIEELYREKRYLKIIKHKNYNPRLISFITDYGRLINIEPSKYWDYIEGTLDNPKDIWSDVFDNQLDDLMRLAVCLIVFNGGEIKEAEFQKTFFEQTINENLATETTVNYVYRKTMRLAVGSILQRVVIDKESEVVLLGLFNPSVADFVLERYKKDKISLQTYFTNLDTIQSIENLYYLRKNKILSNNIYTSILEFIGLRKMKLEYFQEHPTYTLKLARFLIEDNGSFSFDAPSAVYCVVSGINTVPVLPRFVEDGCFVLNFVNNLKKNVEFQYVIKAFIERCLGESPGHDDLVNLHDLAGILDCDIQESVVSAVREDAINYWEDNIDFNITDDNILEEYLDVAEEDEALQKIHEYLEDKLYVFDLTTEDISRISEFADIQSHIESNQDATFHADESYGIGKNLGIAHR